MALVLVLAIVGPVANPGPRHHGDEVGTHGTTPPAIAMNPRKERRHGDNG